jgi:hypothetical protein
VHISLSIKLSFSLSLSLSQLYVLSFAFYIISV